MMDKGYPDDTFCIDFQQALGKFPHQITFKNFFKKLYNQSIREKAFPWKKKSLKSRWGKHISYFQKGGCQKLSPKEIYGRFHNAQHILR